MKTRSIFLASVAASSVGLAGCDSKQENAAENKADAVRDSADAKADAMDDKADAMGGASGEAMENKADAVRASGTKLADDDLAPSDAIVPPEDLSLDEAHELLEGEGLIPDLPIAG